LFLREILLGSDEKAEGGIGDLQRRVLVKSLFEFKVLSYHSR
jgi:hypothetical protein